MTRHVAARIAWGSVALAGALFVAILVLLPDNAAVAEASEPRFDQTLWILSWFGFGVVGALIVSRRPDQRIGWAMSGISLGVYLAAFLVECAQRLRDELDPRMLADEVSSVTARTFQPTYVSLWLVEVGR